jgi:hypothetical protein
VRAFADESIPGGQSVTILYVPQRVGKDVIYGFIISCHNQDCKGTLFMPTKLRFPDEVVGKKFRERGWEVNSSGKDACPNCIIKQRGRKKGQGNGPKPDKNKVVPHRTVSFLEPTALREIIVSSGLPAPAKIEEFDNKNRKFCITFKASGQMQLGQILHAESEICQSFPVQIVSSFIQPDCQSSTDGNVVHIELFQRWYLVLEEMKHQRMEAAE